MKKNIHPEYKKIFAICSCGYTIPVFSTKKKDMLLDLCSQCHPFYTGKQRSMNTKGRIQRFQKRFNLSEI
ncbi:50S ribosomal protein L31 [Buchnera aphidicola (Cinara splendens)]|uniref:Large ribosomal subunit protein bL31 n=2 Tax=Buchnera aphidicola TaxID=9 RepID=A0A451CX77_9GAMM|nr:50S ribosomal protein L31 [Buchnera aphidicola]VFP77959.1 50S ribosomal protein L31 [Buchnera aphidicola (Cinara cf. splendens/pseudotsugae 3390)]VFP85126.1 50S ribosomal protein L31 [Buchnera aphidicola (Cinara splendens)]